MQSLNPGAKLIVTLGTVVVGALACVPNATAIERHADQNPVATCAAKATTTESPAITDTSARVTTTVDATVDCGGGVTGSYKYSYTRPESLTEFEQAPLPSSDPLTINWADGTTTILVSDTFNSTSVPDGAKDVFTGVGTAHADPSSTKFAGTTVTIGIAGGGDDSSGSTSAESGDVTYTFLGAS